LGLEISEPFARYSPTFIPGLSINRSFSRLEISEPFARYSPPDAEIWLEESNNWRLEISEPFARYSPFLSTKLATCSPIPVSKSVSLSLVTRQSPLEIGYRAINEQPVSKSVSLSLVTRRRVTADFKADNVSSRNQ